MSGPGRIRLLLVGLAVVCVSNVHGQTGVYTLPPEKMKAAADLFRLRTVVYFVGFAWSIGQMWLLLATGMSGRMRNTAVLVSRNRWLQAFVFTFLLILATTMLDLPFDMYRHHAAVAYGLSVQSWESWFGDRMKAAVLAWGPLALGAMLVFTLIRRWPGRWWLALWPPAMTMVVLGVWLAPVVIDPWFDHFEPLAKHDPALVARLEQVVARGPLKIAPQRMFWMQASAKSTGLNAYVTGMGASKRLVVWDTTIAKATPDEIAFIFGHEMGHYVLDHILWTLVYVGALMLAAFYVGSHAVRLLLRRYGPAWRVGSQGDWAALPVYLMVPTALSFMAEPLVNGFSRAHEHVADIYGQEAVRGVVADPRGAAVGAFQVLGETSLDDPRPHPWVEWWSETHPSIAERMRFAAGYDPWSARMSGRYFKK